MATIVTDKQLLLVLKIQLLHVVEIYYMVPIKSCGPLSITLKFNGVII